MCRRWEEGSGVGTHNGRCWALSYLLHILPLSVRLHVDTVLNYTSMLTTHKPTFCLAKIGHNKSSEILAYYFITSGLGNVDALLYGISGNLLAKLQRVQNAAARLITRTKKRKHITPVLVFAHWLPIKQCIQYKLMLLAYNVHATLKYRLSDWYGISDQAQIWFPYLKHSRQSVKKIKDTTS